MKKTVLVPLMMLGLFFVVSTGIAQSGGPETNWMVPSGDQEELRGMEFPFPVGFVPEGKD
jgi:hypothetical protein